MLFVAGKTKGCFYPPPYLDDYGETDQGLKYVHTCRHTHKLWLFVIYLFMFVSAGEGTLSICVPSVTGKLSVCGVSTASLRSLVTLRRPIRRWWPSIGSTCDIQPPTLSSEHPLLMSSPSSKPSTFLQPSAELRSDFRDFFFRLLTFDL